MSSELFENKGEEFCTIVDELRRKVKVNLSSSKGGKGLSGDNRNKVYSRPYSSQYTDFQCIHIFDHLNYKLTVSFLDDVFIIF